MRAIIVDDEPANVENLQFLLARHCPSVIVVAWAGSKQTANELISLHRPDLLFLDIRLGQDSGFDILTALPEMSFEVIFVTAFDQYGIRAIKFAALDYLLKPVDIDELVEAVAKAERKIKDKHSGRQLDFLLTELQRDKSKPVRIALPQQKEIRYVSVDTISRCEAANAYTFFYLVNAEKILVSKPLKEYADLLQSHGFIRTHQSHLVNSSYVKSWLKEDGGTLLLASGYKVPISKVNREKVRMALSELMP
ncbi:MAG: response regulator transcription factor [Sphingobacteriaceae bacterium]|nr:MAG: response regulator transcription factor [Sphingobacteriaceae bacterium]